jgi:curved DNA-binding protein CbpA
MQEPVLARTVPDEDPASEMNPYVILNVSRVASKRAIQKAYRILAKKLHPDCGGDPQKFHEATLAYKVLMDPERRKHFNKTGEIKEAPPIHENHEVVSTLAAFVVGVVGEAVKNGVDITAVDILKAIKENLQANRQEAINRIKSVKKLQASLRTAAQRFVSKDGENMLKGCAEGHADLMSRQIKSLENDVARFDKAEKFLKDYSYKFTQAMMTVTVTTGSWTATTANR